MTFSTAGHTTVGFAIPTLEFLQTSWEELLEDSNYVPVYAGIKAGLANLKKWYRKVDDTNAYFICLCKFYLLSYLQDYLNYLIISVLNPTMKLEYTKVRWEQEWHEAGVKQLEDVVCY
jgi:hypothetical protein